MTVDEAQRRRVLEMTPEQRLKLLDQLCRDLTRIATTAKRVV